MAQDKDDELELFQRSMQGVKPLQREERITQQAPRPAPRPRRREQETGGDAGFIETDYASPVSGEEHLFFAQAGLQHKLRQRLKRGDLPIDARLDLHGMSVDEAASALQYFLDSCRDNHLRCVIIIHGKGSRSRDGRAILKTQLNHWLRHSQDVLAFCTAQLKDGGSGAVYVLLRKNK